MKIHIVTLILLSICLSGCGTIQSTEWSYKNWTVKKIDFNKYSDYKSPTNDTNAANVVFITDGLDSYDIYDYRDKTDKPSNKTLDSKDSNAYAFPSKKTDFSFPLPKDFKGKVVYSLRMRTEPHIIKFMGMVSHIFRGPKNCVSYYTFSPEPNKNYIFYFYKLDVSTTNKSYCIVRLDEVIYENGAYNYIPKRAPL